MSNLNLNKKQQIQLQYSLMLLLKKSFKIKFSANYLSTTQKKGVDETDLNILQLSLEEKKRLKAYSFKILDNFLTTGSLNWNIILNSLKEKLFLEQEVNLRKNSLKQFQNTIFIKDFISFLFEKNYGFQIFTVFNKYQLKQKLLVEFLNLNNYTSSTNFDYVNFGVNYLNFKKKIPQYLSQHITTLPTWQTSGIAALAFQNLELPQLKQTFLSVIHIPEPLDFSLDIQDELETDELYFIQETDSANYFLSYDFESVTDLYPRIFLNEEKDNVLKQLDLTKNELLALNHSPRFAKYPMSIPDFIANQQILEQESPKPSDLQELLGKFSTHLNYSATFLHQEEEFALFCQDFTYDQIDQDSFETLDQIDGMFSTISENTDISLYLDEFSLRSVANLIHFDQNDFNMDVDFQIKWGWKHLLTSNFFNINFSETFYQSLKLSEIPLDLNSFFDTLLYNKNFLFRDKQLQDFDFTVGNCSSEKFSKLINFDPFPLDIYEKLFISENLVFDNFNDLSENTFDLTYLSPSPISLNLTFNEFYLNSNYTNIRSYNDSKNAHYTNQFSDKKILLDFTNCLFSNYQYTFTNDSETNTTLLQKYTYFTWPLFYREKSQYYKTLSFTSVVYYHPFLNNFHQSLFRLYQQKVLFIHLNTKDFYIFWNDFTEKQLQNRNKMRVFFDLFLEKLDFSEDFLGSRFTKLNFLHLHELQYTYPLFFLDKQQAGDNNLIVSFRQFWENSTDLYDWYFLQFYDARWQDYMPLQSVKGFQKHQKLLFNFWPASFLTSQKQFYSFNEILYDYDPFNLHKKKTESQQMEVAHQMESYHQYWRNLQPTTKISANELLRQTVYHQTDLMNYPEYMEYDFSSKLFFDFQRNSILQNENLNIVSENINPYHEDLFTLTTVNNETKKYLHDIQKYSQSGILDHKKSALYYHEETDETFELEIDPIRPVKNFLQRFITKRRYFNNFVVTLNKKNHLKTTDWLSLDTQYFFLLILNTFFINKQCNYQELSQHYLSFKQLSLNEQKVLLQDCKKMIIPFIKENYLLFQKIKQNYSTVLDINQLISLLQISYFTENKTILFKEQQFLEFLNKLFFFSETLKLLEEPFSQFWYSFFNVQEIGEFTLQTYITKNTDIFQITKPQYKSLQLLLFSCFSLEEKNMLNDFFSLTVVDPIKKKQEQLKELNNLVLHIFSDWSLFQDYNLFSSFQKLKLIDKERVIFFFSQYQNISKKNIYRQYITSPGFFAQQIDSFSKLQSFFSLSIYQIETFLLFSDYYYWLYQKSFVFLKVLLMFILFYLNPGYFSFFLLFGVLFFLSVRYYINKTMIQDFTVYVHSYFDFWEELKEGETDITSNFLNKALSDLTRNYIMINPVSTYLMQPPFFLYTQLKLIDNKLKQMYFSKYATYYDILPFSKENTVLKFQDLKIKKPSSSNTNITLKQKFIIDKAILPVELSSSSLENFAFDTVKALKLTSLYWGMPITKDTANRNPLFYVLQLSEDYKFYRLFKTKLLQKWFFF